MITDHWPSLVFLLVAIAAFTVAVVWSPYAEDAFNMEERLDYCEADLAAARGDLAATTRRLAEVTRERDVAATRWDEWQGWYEEAHADRTRLAVALEAERTRRFQAELAASAPARVAEIPPPKRKPMATVPKREKVRPRPRLTKRIVYDWSWLFGHDY
jgi:hypothetical protein